MRADARFVLFPQFLERKFNDMSEEIEIKDEVLDLKVTETYDENQIQVLEGLEAVRKRPGMYIGSTSARGLHHLVYEIVDNSIDEALAGYCTHIEVTIEKGDIIRVADNGRGIPCGIHPQMGIPTLEVVLTVLHAGGKFDGSGYKVSGGLHGVGSSVVNALSDWLEAEVRDGHTKHYMRFERGVTTVKMRDTPCESETGTTIRFHADPEIFETTIYEYDVLEKRLREQAFLNAGLKITLRDERDDEPVEEVMHYEGGIRQFVEHLNRTKTPLHENVIYMEGSRDTSMAEVAMQYTVLLAGCYQNCLRIASELNCKTVAFPSISTGVYRFPLNRAAEIAIRTIEEYLSTHAEIEQVSMICFDGTTLSAYQNALSEWEANHV